SRSTRWRRRNGAEDAAPPVRLVRLLDPDSREVAKGKGAGQDDLPVLGRPSQLRGPLPLFRQQDLDLFSDEALPDLAGDFEAESREPTRPLLRTPADDRVGHARRRGAGSGGETRAVDDVRPHRPQEIHRALDLLLAPPGNSTA